MNTPLLTTEGLAVGHGGKALLRELELRLPMGQLVAVLGVNGIGKSTLLRTLAGLHAPVAGKVLIKDHDVHALQAMERARLVSVVLSGRPSIGLLDVRTLVGLGRQPWTGAFGGLSEADERIVSSAMERVGVSGLKDREGGFSNYVVLP